MTLETSDTMYEREEKGIGKAISKN